MIVQQNAPFESPFFDENCQILRTKNTVSSQLKRVYSGVNASNHSSVFIPMKATWLALALASGGFAQAIVPVSDKTFEFRSGFWINLDRFLYEQALADPAPAAVAPEWTAALDYYRKKFIKGSQPSGEIVELHDRLSDLESVASLKGSNLDPELIAILEAAAPVYRARWWAAHDQGNRAWIRAVSPMLSKYSPDLKKDLVKAYATAWPSMPIRVDVSEYADWAGAYTTIDPSHITISSAAKSNQGDAALEMLFHEASHTIIQKVRDTMGAEAQTQNKLYRNRDLWHIILFYTTGEIVREHLKGYVPYAFKNNLYDGRWQGVPEILEKDWKPYLDGKVDMTTAIRRLIVDYGVDLPTKAKP